MKQYACKNCGKIFYRFSSMRRGKVVFCSYKCMGQYRRGENHPNWKTGLKGKKHICITCGKEFYNYPPSVKRKYCSQKCYKRKGRTNPNWKGGKIRQRGYIYIYSPNHPFPHVIKNTPYVLESRLVLEKKIGKYLEPNKIAHHINGIKDDNRPENLQLMTKSEHMRHHIKLKNPRHHLQHN